jgi:hypothetical protein
MIEFGNLTTKESFQKNGNRLVETFNQEGKLVRHLVIHPNGEKLETENYGDWEKTTQYTAEGKPKTAYYFNKNNNIAVTYRYDSEGNTTSERIVQNVAKPYEFVTELFYKDKQLVKKTYQSKDFQTIINYKENGFEQVLSLKNGELSSEVIKNENGSHQSYTYQNGRIKEMQHQEADGTITEWKLFNPLTGQILRNYAEEIRQAQKSVLLDKARHFERE